MLSYLKFALNFVKKFIKYLIQAVILYVATFTFSILNIFMPLPQFNMILKIGVFAVTLYLIDTVFANVLPFLEGFENNEYYIE